LRRYSCKESSFLEVCSYWRWTSWEKRYRLSFTDPCNIRTVSLYLYFTIEGFIEIFPLSAYINSKRHFYLSDKLSQVLGTSPGTAGKSGKRRSERPAGDGRKTSVSHSRRNYWRDMKGPKLLLINPERMSVSREFMRGSPDSLTVSLEFVRIIFRSFSFRYWHTSEICLISDSIMIWRLR